MTPAQQTALETLAGRALTADDIGALDPLLALRNDVAMATYLSHDRAAIQSRTVGIGTVLATLAPDGGAFLDAIEQLAGLDPNVKWGLKLLERGELDVGMAATRALLTGIAGNVPELAAGINALLALAEVAEPIQYNALSDALNVAEGRLTL